MTKGFAKAFAATMQHEGGYVHRAGDRGGETYMGIARNFWPLWPGWPVVDACRQEGRPLSLEPGLAELVRQFYLVNFWNTTRCHEVARLSQMVAGELFDAAVNCGSGNGVRFMQRGLTVLNGHGRLYPDLIADGVPGPKTMEALRLCLAHRPEHMLYRCQNGERYIYYKSIPYHQANPGWFGRT